MNQFCYQSLFLMALSSLSNSVNAFEAVTDLSSQWFDETVAAPSYGSSGSARQGWINGLDGWFNEEWHIGGTRTNNHADTSDTYTGFIHLQKRLTRRIGIGVDLPFITNTGDETGIGDFGIMLKGMLYETQDISISAGFDSYFATADKSHQGGEVWRISPHVDIYKDLGNAFSFQGGVILDVLPESNTKADTAITGKFGFGRTMTSHNAFLGDLTPHLVTTVKVPMGGAENDNVFVSLTPGIRTHMSGGYILLGLEIPVTGPNTFENRATFMYIRGF